MTVDEIINLLPLSILEIISNSTDKNKIEEVIVYLKFEKIIPFSENNLNDLSQEGRNKYLLNLLKDIRVKSVYTDDMQLNLYNLQ